MKNNPCSLRLKPTDMNFIFIQLKLQIDELKLTVVNLKLNLG